MTSDMMFGERDLEAEVKEKDEIIMSLRLNEHLLKDKLEICRGNMSKLLERITALEKENIELKKYKKYCAEWMGVREENLSLRCVKISENRFGLVEEIYNEIGKQQIEIMDNLEKQIVEKQKVVDLLNEMNEDIQYLNAFLVEQGLAEEYIRWKGDD